MSAIELNADVGELPGDAGRAADREILGVVSAANIACGAHAGDDGTMEATLRACRELGVVAAAHPGYPDREGFGRRRGALAPEEVRACVAAQLGRLAAHAARLGMTVSRVKAHGALYNESARDRALAEAVLSALREVLPGAAILALAGSPLVAWGEAAGLRVLREGFADRASRPDGTLVPRGEPGAMIEDETEAAANAVRLARGGRLDTLCLHGDGPGAAARARAVRAALESAGIAVRAATPTARPVS